MHVHMYTDTYTHTNVYLYIIFTRKLQVYKRTNLKNIKNVF